VISWWAACRPHCSDKATVVGFRFMRRERHTWSELTVGPRPGPIASSVTGRPLFTAGAGAATCYRSRLRTPVCRWDSGCSPLGYPYRGGTAGGVCGVEARNLRRRCPGRRRLHVWARQRGDAGLSSVAGAVESLAVFLRRGAVVLRSVTARTAASPGLWSRSSHVEFGLLRHRHRTRCRPSRRSPTPALRSSSTSRTTSLDPVGGVRSGFRCHRRRHGKRVRTPTIGVRRTAGDCIRRPTEARPADGLAIELVLLCVRLAPTGVRSSTVP